jgi:hypothetical protein
MPSLVDNQVLVDAILEFYKNVVNSLFFAVDTKPKDESPDNLFRLLNALLEAYKTSQAKRFCSAATLASVEDEAQVYDLILLLQMISTSTTKELNVPGGAVDHAELLLCKNSKSLIFGNTYLQ